ncbi:NUDIX hydrolase domain-like protein [Chaetomium fimeti]|uniref:NUDIX hydrolase domain-like protein n=1 Tax=Chaetomium fimeti TaxID=1854472 RepID=A0AAE0LRZ8_9PEZI|nr:NUDIX hydrolase domain-like protein [Chaetomium fimeti]
MFSSPGPRSLEIAVNTSTLLHMRGLHSLRPAWILAGTPAHTRCPSFSRSLSADHRNPTTLNHNLKTNKSGTTTQPSPPPTPPSHHHPSQPTATKMSKPQPQPPVITSITDLPTADAKWITLQRISYRDQTGTARTWEAASRKTRAQSAGVDAVAMGNVLLHPSRPPATLLVIQYRPPLDAFTVEWPAGLVDEGETAERAAVREFREETGYDCEVVSVSPVQAADPGLSSANMQLVMVEVRLGEGEPLPEQRLEDGEHIQRVVVPLAELYGRLVEYSRRERTVVAAKLFHFAAGMEFAKTKGKEYGL